MHEAPQINFDEPMPLFPLPNCVLLPHATIPLHIFEPRYQAKTEAALASRSLIAMASFEGNDWKQNYDGKPPLRPHACIGYIVRHEKLRDGRYNMLLQGLCRAQIVEELPCESYRLGVLEPTEPNPVMEIDLGEHRQRIERLLGDDLLKQLASVSAIHNWLSGEIPTTALIDLAIMSICDDLDERYSMLVETDAAARGHWLERALRRMRDTLALADRIGPSKSADGLCLN